MVAVFRSLGLPLVIIACLFLALAFFGGYSEWISLLFLTGFLGMAAITFIVVWFRALLEPMMSGATVYPALVLLAVAYVGLLFVAAKYPDLEVDDPNSKAVTAPRLTPTFLGGAYFALPRQTKRTEKSSWLKHPTQHRKHLRFASNTAPLPY